MGNANHMYLESKGGKQGRKTNFKNVKCKL